MHDQVLTTIRRFRHTLFLTALMCGVFSRVVATPLVTAELLPHSRDVFTVCHLSPSPELVATQSPATLGKGKFLVASRDLNDPNFAESVILLLDYTEHGALGVIINRPTEVPLSDLLPGIKALQKRKDVVHVGGPVARHMVMILTRTTKPPHDAQHVFSDTYLIAQQTGLEQVLQSGGKHAKVRAYVGYAGWAAGQLDMEVSAGGWLIVPADSALIFDKPPTNIWSELIRRGEAQWTSNQLSRPAGLLVKSSRFLSEHALRYEPWR